jgi:hypothetical protein
MRPHNQTTGVSHASKFSGLKVAIVILRKWTANPTQACRILRISRSTYRRTTVGESRGRIGLDADQLMRITLVLNTHAALRMTFDNPTNVYGFMAVRNHTEFSNGRTPLAIMSQGDFISLYETFRRIDALSQSLW